MEAGLHEYLGWALLSILKFVLSPSAMIAAGYSWLFTVLLVGTSSSLGSFLFYFFGDFLFKSIDRLRKKPAKKFTSLNRRVVKIKSKYGLLGMGVIAGVLSVPLAGLITAKFFKNPAQAIPTLGLSFSAWTLLLTSISWLVKNLFQNGL